MAARPVIRSNRRRTASASSAGLSWGALGGLLSRSHRRSVGKSLTVTVIVTAIVELSGRAVQPVPRRLEVEDATMESTSNKIADRLRHGGFVRKDPDPMTPDRVQRRTGTPARRASAFGTAIELGGAKKRVPVRSGQVMTAIVGATLAASLAISGCSNSKTDSSSASSSKSTPDDYSKLLITASDIDLPGDTFTSPKPPQGFPKGAAVGFWNGDHSRVIDDRITIAPDSATAEAAFEGAKQKLSTALPDTVLTDVPVGQGGAMGVAKSKDGSKAVNTITFHEGRANVTMEFDSPVNDPSPQGFVIAVAQKQDAAVKSGLPG